MFCRFFPLLLLVLCACAGAPQPAPRSAEPVTLESGPLYIVPFDTVMVPAEVSAGLFDLFVDRLNLSARQSGVEFVILKQGLASVDSAWLADKNYLKGEVFAYIEDVGSDMTNIKARSRIRLYRPGDAAPAYVSTVPTETFYQNNYSSLSVERRKIVEEIATALADRLLAAIAVR